MNKIEWSNELSVGIPEIDEQHRILINIMNRAYEYFTSGATFDIIQIEYELWNYTKYHFETEEHIMKLVGYPELDDHLSEHMNFIMSVSRMRKDVATEEEIAVKIVGFLGNWLYSHILSTDKKLGLYHKNNRL